MAKHNLALDIPETANPYVLRVVDVSTYAAGLSVDCGRFDITMPGFAAPVFIENVEPGSSKNLSAEDLGLVQLGDTSPVALQDGVYTIKYSVSPNDLAYVEYYHLRNTNQVNQYLSILCKLRLEPCEPSAELEANLHKLRLIKLYIDAAKAQVESCHAIKQGMEMYEYASKLLTKFYDTCCSHCH